MNLNYSFNGIEQHWFDGDLPFPDMRTEHVKVHLSGQSSSHFPPFFPIGDLLASSRSSPKQQAAVTLVLTYHHKNVPLSTSPPREGEWEDVPGSPVYGLIGIPLPPDAVRLIRRVSANDHGYELALENVQLTNVTKKKNPKDAVRLSPLPVL